MPNIKLPKRPQGASVEQPSLRDRGARAWLERGAPIVPLAPRSKVPVNGGGSKAPITTREELDKFLRDSRDGNYGVITGRRSGFIVIDVDGRKGHQTWSRLIKGRALKSVTVITGRGYHVYFTYSGSRPIRSRAGTKLGSGIDVRAEGAYVVGVGSRHASGEVYDYADGLGPSSVEILELPDWLAALLLEDSGSTATIVPASPEPSVALASPAPVREGGRNDRLTSVAGQLQNTGIAPDALLAALVAENEKRCDPPLDRSEVEKIAASVSRYVAKPASGDEAEQLCQTVLNDRFAGGSTLLLGLDPVLVVRDVALEAASPQGA